MIMHSVGGLTQYVELNHVQQHDTALKQYTVYVINTYIHAAYKVHCTFALFLEELTFIKISNTLKFPEILLGVYFRKFSRQFSK